ncbi:transposase [Serratia plymuthica]|nr:transposase [Serratia plymuthica]
MRLNSAIITFSGFKSKTCQRYSGRVNLQKKAQKKRKNRRSRGRLHNPTTQKEQQVSGREPWLIFTSTNGFKSREIMKLYSRRMQIEQNFRDEKVSASDSGVVPVTPYSRSKVLSH